MDWIIFTGGWGHWQPVNQYLLSFHHEPSAVLGAGDTTVSRQYSQRSHRGIQAMNTHSFSVSAIKSLKQAHMCREPEWCLARMGEEEFSGDVTSEFGPEAEEEVTFLEKSITNICVVQREKRIWCSSRMERKPGVKEAGLRKRENPALSKFFRLCQRLTTSACYVKVANDWENVHIQMKTVSLEQGA